MNIPTSETPSKDSFALHEFMSSLRRLLKVGIYYPSGHIVLDKATKRFMSQLKQIAGEKPCVEFKIFNNNVTLEGIELDPEQPPVKEFNDLMTTLGVVGMKIDRQISMPELHTFVRRILYYRSKTINSKQFTQVELDDLPHSIEIERLEFLSRGDSSLAQNAPETSENLHSFISSLTQHGLSEGEIQQCRTLLESLPEKLAKSNLQIADLPSASWDDVAGLLTRALRSGQLQKTDGKKGLSSGANINALTSILRKLELETEDSKSRDALKLLLTVIHKPSEQKPLENGAAEETLSLPTFPDKPTVSISKIQDFASNLKLDPKICAKISLSSQNNETLSILMQLAGHAQSMPAQIQMQKLIRTGVTVPLSEKSWKILSGGLHTIIRSGNTTRLSATIRFLVEPLRTSLHGTTLQLFFHTIKLCNTEEQKLLWPYVVNEILVEGSSKDKIAYHQLCQVAARFSAQQMSAMLPELSALEAFENNKVAPDIFHAVSPSCYSLFAFLYKTKIERSVGERIIGGLRRNPRDWLIKAVAPLLNLNQQEHKLFLYSYLRQAPQKKEISVALKKIAARIIFETLTTLPQERRNEQWVENTIAALSQLPGEKTVEVLTQIAGAKKMLFIPKWPAACRTAAQTSLSAVKGKY